MSRADGSVLDSPCCCNKRASVITMKHLTQRSLRKEGFLLDHSLRSAMVRKSWQLKQEAAGHMESVVRKQKQVGVAMVER